MTGLKEELSLRSEHSSHSVNKNITGMALPLAASCLVEEAKEAYPVLSIPHPGYLLAALRWNPLPSPRTSRSTTCRQGLAGCSWALHSASSMAASQPPCIAITASSMMRPGAPSLSWCSTFGPHLSARPSTLRQRPCASSSPPPCELVRPHCPTSTVPAKTCQGPQFKWPFVLSTGWGQGLA